MTSLKKIGKKILLTGDGNDVITLVGGKDSSDNAQVLSVESGGMATVVSPDSAIKAGQSIIAVTGTAVRLPSNALLNGVIIRASVDNASEILVGGSGVTNTANGSGNGHVLAAGESVSYAGSNTNDLYINGTAGDWVSFIGS